MRAPDTIKKPARGKSKYIAAAVIKQIIASSKIKMKALSKFLKSLFRNFKPLSVIRTNERPSKNHAERVGKREGEISFSLDN